MLGLPSDQTCVRVLIEVPLEWIDFDSPLGFLSSTIRQMAERQIRDAVVEQITSKIDPKTFKVDKKKVEKMIVQLLAERAIRGETD